MGASQDGLKCKILLFLLDMLDATFQISWFATVGTRQTGIMKGYGVLNVIKHVSAVSALVVPTVVQSYVPTYCPTCLEFVELVHGN